MNSDCRSAEQALATARPLDQVRIVGGRVCLDFVNTVHDRFAAVREDYLTDTGRYLEWSRQVGILTPAEYAGLCSDRRNERLIRDVRKFREELYAFLLEGIRRRIPPGPPLLAYWMTHAWAGLRFDVGSRNYVAWAQRAFDPYLPLKRIALDVLEMLQHGQRSRLRVCAARGECGWLFYDASKSGTRRWCSMETCGAIQKMRRYRS